MTDTLAVMNENKSPTIWDVNVNNTQRHYIVEAGTAADACIEARNIWLNDKRTNTRQRARGIYDMRVRPAKFGEIRLYGITPSPLRTDLNMVQALRELIRVERQGALDMIERDAATGVVDCTYAQARVDSYDFVLEAMNRRWPDE